jgi:hypothetical protein
MNPLYATVEEFAAEGFTQIECHCPRCRVTRLRAMSWLPRISMGLTQAAREDASGHARHGGCF